MDFQKKPYKKFSKNSYNSFILGGDIGGTNCSLGIFGIRKNFSQLLVSFHFDSKKLDNLHSAINKALSDFKKNSGITITKACLGIAGAVSYKRNYVHLTNAKLDVATKELKKKTQLKNILLMNDFEAVGYGINIISKKDAKTIKNAIKIPKAPIAVIGAGTGLGAAALFYNEDKKIYIPVPSEAHHTDFPAQNKLELELAEFIKKYRNIKSRVSNGDILSGDGLENIYLFLRKSRRFKETRYIKEVDASVKKPEIISKYRNVEPICKETFRIFKAAYAGFAKNMALGSLAFGGVYIAGGIAPKNKEIFDREFVKIFEESHKMRRLLEKIPVYLVLNYDIGLLGAGFAGARFLD